MRGSTILRGACLAAALVLTGSAGALAGDAADAAPQVAVSIPTVEAVESSMPDAALKAVLSGDIVGHANDLANLSAKSIHIPKISVSVTDEGDDAPVTVVYRDVDIADVESGKAARVSLGGMEIADEDATATLGAMRATDVDIAAMLQVYGLTPAPEGMGMTPLYGDAEMAGGTLVAEGMTCTIGKAKIGGASGRPLKKSIVAYIEETQRQKRASKHKSGPVTMDVAMFTDLMTAFETKPGTFDGFDCTGTDEDGQPVAFSMGPVKAGAFKDARYPEIEFSSLTFTAPKASGSLKSFTLKPMDLKPVLETLARIDGTYSEAWMDANGYRLLPRSEGLAFSGLKLDTPLPGDESERLRASLDSYDLTLGNYHGGIPTRIASHLDGLTVKLPERPSNPVVALLKGMGLGTVTFGYGLSSAWDAETQTIRTDDLTLDAGELGHVTLTSLLGNASEALFSSNEAARLAAGRKLTFKAASLDVTNTGLVDMLYTIAAASQGQSVENLKLMAAGMSQASIMMALGGNPNAGELARAISTLLGGGRSLSATITAKPEAGLGMTDLEAMDGDPTALADQIAISASAQ